MNVNRSLSAIIMLSSYSDVDLDFQGEKGYTKVMISTN